MTPRLQRAVRDHGFTLVELLVVIGVLVILFSLLLPSLRLARERALSVRCASNLRQIFYACLMYASENGDKLPIPPMVEDRDFYNHVLAIPMKDVGIMDFEDGTLWPYLSPDPRVRQQLFTCPADEALTRTYTVGGPRTLAYERNFSYAFNIQLHYRSTDYDMRNLANGVVPTKLGIKYAEIRKPQRKIMILDMAAPDDGCALYTSFGWADSPMADRHNGRGNQCFADGHVEAIFPIGGQVPREESLVYPMTPPSKYFELLIDTEWAAPK